MRKITFIEVKNETRKLMIYESKDETYLFGYDCLQDSFSKWDLWFSNIEDAEEYCEDNFNVDNEDWILIDEPKKDCQHDFIMPTKRISKDIFEMFVNGKWHENIITEKIQTFDGLSGNERLFISGLIDEFDKAKVNDSIKSNKILKALNID
jgi:hypothetical protein